MSGARAVSPVLGTVLLIAVAVALAVGVLAAGAAMASLDSPPRAVAEADPVVAACAGCGPTDQVIRLRHRTGDAVPVADVALVVSVPGRETARLGDLPLPINCLRDAHVGGTDLFDGRCGRVGGALTAVGSDTDGVWSAGDTLSVRLRKGAVRLRPGEELTVRIVHAASGAVVAAVHPTVVAG